MAKPSKVDPVILFVSALPLAAGVLTLLPAETASEPCLLGYRALCSFAPISTLLCLVGSFYLFRFLSHPGDSQHKATGPLPPDLEQDP